jgi:uncharacterized membrane protein YhaH (DUF805 family)
MRFGYVLFSFQGRINRLQYWLACVLILLAALLLLGLPFLLVGGTGMKGDGAAAIGVLALLFFAAIALMTWCSLAVQVKRFHDRGRSGWLSLLPVALLLAASGLSFWGLASSNIALIALAQPFAGAASLVNLWFFIELGFFPGKFEANKYGDPPGSGPTATSAAPQGAAALSLSGAAGAMDRAIADRARGMTSGVAPAPAAPPRLSPVGGASASFGRRATH